MSRDYHEITPQSTIIGRDFNLSSADIEHRSKSYVDEKTLRLMGVRRISDDQGYQIMGYDWRKADFVLSGLAIPYLNVLHGSNGNRSQTLEHNIRRDFPDKKTLPGGEIKLGRKYIKPSRPNLLYIFPQIRPEWLKDNNKTKIITEGEFKAAAMFRALSKDFTTDDLEYIPLALSGVENWKQKRHITTAHGEKTEVKDFLVDLETIGIKGQSFIILFDSDLDEKPQVRSARWRLTNALRERGAKVFHADCPKEFEGTPTKGIDDYLGAVEAAGGDPHEALIKVLQDAEKPKKPATTVTPENFILRKYGEDRPGVYYTEATTGEESFVCPPLEILAKTEDGEGDNCGRLLEWRDDAGRVKRWAMPVEFIYADGAELVKHLASRGLNISPLRKNRERIAVYIQSVKPAETIISTDKIGWHDECFVLPDETIGECENRIIYQTLFEGHHNFKTSGTLKDWQENISRYCAGNSILTIAVSAAFASPLLPILNEKGGGLHFRGLTSLGKTTALLCAGSVWGGDDEHGFIQTWKATSNGLEIIAASHNHSLLCLDEIGECDPREVGTVAYMLANGKGKARMTKTIQAKKSFSWNLMFLSTGEKSLADIISESGGRVQGGQDIRLCDIEADTGKHGIFENLHDKPDGAALSFHLRSASLKYYGTASREYVRFLTECDFDDLRRHWEQIKAKFVADCLKEVGEQSFSPEVGRVAQRFALIALAGELATEADVTGWPRGAAYEQTKLVFLRWFKARGGNTRSDEDKAFRQVVAFFEANEARFQDTEFPDNPPVNRAGYVRRERSGKTVTKTFYVLPENFRREIAKGFDFKFVAKLLVERGYLKTPKAENKYLSGIGSPRVYEMSDVLDEVSKTNAANL